MKRSRLPMNLQFFAETAASEKADGMTEEETDVVAKEDVEAGKAGAEKDEVEKPEKVEEAAGRKKEDIAALVQEELKKASMSPQERQTYEKEQKEKNLMAREDAVSLRERQADAKELLDDSGLPAEFRDMVTGRDKAETQENVKMLKTRFDAAVQAQVEERLKGKTPPGGSGVTGGSEKDTLMAQVEGYLG